MDTKGIITVASGRKYYWSLATDLALSVLRHTKLPISILVDPTWKDFRHTQNARVFDQVLDLPSDALGKNLSKLYTAELSPYDNTLYLDADTLLTGHVSKIFDRIRQNNGGI